MYRLWFQMLRLSPSYELARRFRAENGNLSTQDQARLPEDFDLVLAVYDDFGDLNRSHFSDWWLDCGLQLFGSKGKAPKVSPIAKIQHDDVDQKLIGQAIKQHLNGEWLEQNQPNSLLLSVPLNQTREQILKQVKQLLDQHIEQKHISKPAKYKLANNNVHVQNVSDAVQVLLVRALNPDWELWKVGVGSKLSKKLSGKFNVNTTRRTDNNFDDLRNLESMTSRKYKIARNISENAARGIFPSLLTCEHAVAFDPYEFQKIFIERRQWMIKKPPSNLEMHYYTM
jgi:hypothetical protein